MNVNRELGLDDIKDLSQLGVSVVRASFAFDPLFRKAPPYGLNPHGLKYLYWLLQQCKNVGISVIVDPHTGPGFSKNTTTLPTDPFWTNYKWHDLFIAQWRELARNLMNVDLPIGALDLLNEPAVPLAWKAGSPSDYHAFVERLCGEIRSVGFNRWVIVEVPRVGFGKQRNTTDPFLAGTRLMQGLAHGRIIYGFNMYWPTALTHYRIGKRKVESVVDYPGYVGDQFVDKDVLRKVLQPIRELEKSSGYPIMVGEFSAVRWLGDVGDRYVRDLIAIFEEAGWSWAYHAFRSSEAWDAEVLYDGESPGKTRETERLRILRKSFGESERICPP